MAAKTLRELFASELRDMYDGERQLTRALPKMGKATESEELQAALTTNLQETERQVARPRASISQDRRIGPRQEVRWDSGHRGRGQDSDGGIRGPAA